MWRGLPVHALREWWSRGLTHALVLRYGGLSWTPFPSQIDLYAGALFVHICLGWNFYLSTVLMLVITALYTIAGTVPGQGGLGAPGKAG